MNYTKINFNKIFSRYEREYEDRIFWSIVKSIGFGVAVVSIAVSKLLF